MNTQSRTSKAQIFFILKGVRKVLAVLFNHVRRHRGFYGFFSGIATTLVTLVAIIWYGVFAYPLPWKVVDPSDPRFNPKEFKFTDYENSANMGRALDTIIHTGASKEKVDVILKRYQAKITPYKPARYQTISPNLYYYTYRNLRSIALELLFMVPADDFSWEIAIEYDENDRVKKIVPINP